MHTAHVNLGGGGGEIRERPEPNGSQCLLLLRLAHLNTKHNSKWPIYENGVDTRANLKVGIRVFLAEVSP